MAQAAADTAAAAEAAAGEAYPLRVRRVDRREVMARLDTYVRRMERRYEYGSDEMLERLQTGVQKCTAEISQWMFNYRNLAWWRDGCDPATGERSETWEPLKQAASGDACGAGLGARGATMPGREGTGR